MHRVLRAFFLFCLTVVPAFCQQPATVQEWLTNRDRSILFEQQPSLPLTPGPPSAAATISLDESRRFQTIDGFGYALTGGSAELLMKMEPAKRHALLEELFGAGPNARHISYLRVGIGTTDMDSQAYTYDDMPFGQKDPSLAHFSMAKDEQYLLPALREIRAIAPNLPIMASPWTCPTWMKRSEHVDLTVGANRFRLAAAFLLLFVLGTLLLTQRWLLRLLERHPLLRYTPALALLGTFIAWLAFLTHTGYFKKHGLEEFRTVANWALFDNDDTRGGQLNPAYCDAYSRYLVRYLEQMQSRGLPIQSMSLQNEPLTDDNRPSLTMHTAEQETLIARYFGPLLKASGLPVKLEIYDHSLDHPEYALLILGDPAAAQYIDGSAFHLYAGTISTMSSIHRAFPDKNLYFTEQMVVEAPYEGGLWPVGEPIERIVIGATRNWAKNVILWNLASDPQFGPHQHDGACPSCLGAITLQGNTVTRNNGYYTLAHVASFIPPGSVRIASPDLAAQHLANVAFLTPEGKTVLLVVNSSEQPQTFTVSSSKGSFQASLPYLSVATFVW